MGSGLAQERAPERQPRNDESRVMKVGITWPRTVRRGTFRPVRMERGRRGSPIWWLAFFAPPCLSAPWISI